MRRLNFSNNVVRDFHDISSFKLSLILYARSRLLFAYKININVTLYEEIRIICINMISSRIK